MVQRKSIGVIFAADRERRTGNVVRATHASGQTTDKGGFATPEVADQHQNFTPAQFGAERRRELLGGI